MKNNWQCRLKKVPKKLTVGEKFLLICDGESPSGLKPPVHIEFFNEKDNYSLHVLKSLDIKDYYLAMEVVSYRVGRFQNPFIITDGHRRLVIDNLSFTVHSVLTKKGPIQPHGRIGPVKSWPSNNIVKIINISLFSGFTIYMLNYLYRFFKRKSFIQTVIKRESHQNPSKFFVLRLRRQKNNLPHQIKELQQSFKIFLEDLFLIPATERNTYQIMQSLKAFHPLVYKKEGPALRQILDELSNGQEGEKPETFLKLKKTCQDIVFRLSLKEK